MSSKSPSSPFEPEDVARQLLNGARQFARTGLEAYLNQDWSVFFLHCGTAIEHLAKCYLASMHPTLVMDQRDFDSLLHACGLAKHARRPMSRIRTITATVALDRAEQFLARLSNIRDRLGLLIDARNGVAHISSHQGAPRDSLDAFLHAANILREALNVQATEYWGDFAEVVSTWTSETVVEGKRKTHEIVAAAKLEFDKRFGGMDDEAREIVIRAIEESYVAGEQFEYDYLECPACDRKAQAHGSYEVSWEPDYDVEGGEGYVSGAYPVVTFFPGQLSCRVCGLEIAGDEQLRAVEVNESWPLEDVDVEELERDMYENHYDDR